MDSQGDNRKGGKRKQPDPADQPQQQQMAALQGQPSAGSAPIDHISPPLEQFKKMKVESEDKAADAYHKTPDASRPDEATSMVGIRRDLNAIKSGWHLLPPGAYDEFNGTNVPKEAYITDDVQMWPWPTHERYPALYFINSLLTQVSVCNREKHDIASWNMEVHRPILDWVFRPGGRRGFVDYYYSAGVPITPEYRNNWKLSTAPSFCIIVRPRQGSVDDQKINDLCKSRPNQSINHIDRGSLRRTPILVSIVTRLALESDEAQLQLFLQHAAHAKSMLQGRRRETFSNLQVLLGIVVVGPYWRLFPGRMMDGQFKLDYYILLGNTTSVFETMQLLMALARLAKFVEKDYWPDVKEDFLGF